MVFRSHHPLLLEGDILLCLNHFAMAKILLLSSLESVENLGIETGPASSRGLVRMMLRWR